MTSSIREAAVNERLGWKRMPAGGSMPDHFSELWTVLGDARSRGASKESENRNMYTAKNHANPDEKPQHCRWETVFQCRGAPISPPSDPFDLRKQPALRDTEQSD